MIHGSDLRDFASLLSDGLQRAAHALRRSPEREFYDLVLLPGNQVHVQLNPHVSSNQVGYVAGELTQVTDAGLCIAHYDEAEYPESLLRLVPYSSILCVIELAPKGDDDE